MKGLNIKVMISIYKINMVWYVKTKEGVFSFPGLGDACTFAIGYIERRKKTIRVL